MFKRDRDQPSATFYRMPLTIFICLGSGKSAGRDAKYRAPAVFGSRNSTLPNPAPNNFASMSFGLKKLTNGSPTLATLSANWRSASAAIPAVPVGGCLKVSTTSLPDGHAAMDFKAESMAASLRYTVTPSHEKNVGSFNETWLRHRPSSNDSCSKSICANRTFAANSRPAFVISERLTDCVLGWSISKIFSDFAQTGCRNAKVSKPAPRMTYWLTPRCTASASRSSANRERSTT